MSRPAGRGPRPTPAPIEVRPWVLRRAVEVPETTRCATCHREDVSFLVLDSRDMKWRCAACSKPAVETLAEVPRD